MSVELPCNHQADTAAIWKTGLEIELLAPAGRSRANLAEAIAERFGGKTTRIFYPQSEFSRLDNAPVFENLTLGYDVLGREDELIARCVDDLTIVDDLAAAAAPKPGWYRIVSDDRRWINLAARLCDPSEPAETVLDPLARLFATQPLRADGDFVRICDQEGASVAMCAPLPGERERPCELITAPLTVNREVMLSGLLSIARQEGFTVPAESATHIHFDGRRLASSGVIAALVRVFGTYRQELRDLVKTNPRCVRLGDWPSKVYRTVAADDFEGLSWQQAAQRLRETGALKYCDFNFVNLLAGLPGKFTFEVRILPGSLDSEFILNCVALFEALLKRCAGSPQSTRKLPAKLQDFLTETDLSPGNRAYWTARMQTAPRRQRFWR